MNHKTAEIHVEGKAKNLDADKLTSLTQTTKTI